MELTIIDDSGLLGLVVPSAYKSFVDEEWTYGQIVSHFGEQATAKNIMVWDCGDGGNEYQLTVRSGFSDTAGFREARGTINPVNGKIYLVSYTSLTMAAQFEDVTLPEAHDANLFFELPAEPTIVRVIQTYDPATIDFDSFSGPHFVVEYEAGDAGTWSCVAWDSNS